MTDVQCSDRRSSCLPRKHAWGGGDTGLSKEGLALGGRARGLGKQGLAWEDPQGVFGQRSVGMGGWARGSDEKGSAWGNWQGGVGKKGLAQGARAVKAQLVTHPSMDCEGDDCKLFTEPEGPSMQQEPRSKCGGRSGGRGRGGGGTEQMGVPKCSSLMFAFRSSTNGTKHCLPTAAVSNSHDCSWCVIGQREAQVDQELLLNHALTA